MKFVVRMSIACYVDALRNTGFKTTARALDDFNKSLR